jgi:hypothetical protein
LHGVAGLPGVAERGFWTRNITEHRPLTVLQPPLSEEPMAPILVWNTTGVPSGTGLPKPSASITWTLVAFGVVDAPAFDVERARADRERALHRQAGGHDDRVGMVEMSGLPPLAVPGRVASTRNEVGVAPELTVVITLPVASVVSLSLLTVTARCSA